MEDESWNIETQQCEVDACALLQCPEGEICMNGNCGSDPCYGTSCNWGDVCVAGSCIPDPCKDLKCPSYTHCVVDSGMGMFGARPMTACGFRRRRATL
jgi:hypothetical protein